MSDSLQYKGIHQIRAGRYLDTHLVHFLGVQEDYCQGTEENQPCQTNKTKKKQPPIIEQKIVT